MCGYLASTMSDTRPEDLDMTKDVYKAFIATGKDLKKIGSTQEEHGKEIVLLKSEIVHVQRNLSEVKEEVSEMKETVSEMKGKVDSMNAVVGELAAIVKEHFRPERMKEQVVGSTIMSSCKSKKFWLTLLFTIFIIGLAGVGFYHLVLMNPDIAKHIVSAATSAAI